MRVILADDSPIQRDITRSILRAFSDIEVIGAYEDGEKALAGIRSLSPDLAILDYIMPVCTGHEIIEIAKREGLPTKFVFATSMGQKAGAFSSGVPVLIKPFSAAMVKIALHKAGLWPISTT